MYTDLWMPAIGRRCCWNGKATVPWIQLYASEHSEIGSTTVCFTKKAHHIISIDKTIRRTFKSRLTTSTTTQYSKKLQSPPSASGEQSLSTNPIVKIICILFHHYQTQISSIRLPPHLAPLRHHQPTPFTGRTIYGFVIQGDTKRILAPVETLVTVQSRLI
ncbi:hypothetical protein SeMB42_g02395 [Synchytrium endobioticum]|uniref:Uncharacterized protein n=1 Tax=Synchytrium endobioticum TaxID=286115 RepID=A0A507DFI7_9FUNG|nr:hypothetical protein SeMB42_g02393 [Synchytrium endobioticum]TPX50017.1 hypothetical protein SeMB42_g02395 [Synchytrium endobioticum]